MKSPHSPLIQPKFQISQSSSSPHQTLRLLHTLSHHILTHITLHSYFPRDAHLLLPLHLVCITEVRSALSLLKMLALSRLDAWVYLRGVHERIMGDDTHDAEMQNQSLTRNGMDALEGSLHSVGAKHRITPQYLAENCPSMDQYLQINLILPHHTSRISKHTSIIYEFAEEYAVVESRHIDDRGNVWSDVKWDGVRYGARTEEWGSCPSGAQIVEHIAQIQQVLQFSHAQLASWLLTALKDPAELTLLLSQDYSSREIRLIFSSLISPLLVQLFIIDSNHNTTCLIVHLIYLILIRDEVDVSRFVSGAGDTPTVIDFNMLFESLSPVHHAASPSKPSSKLIHFLSSLTELRLFSQHWRHDASDEAWPLWTETPLHVSHAYDSDMTDLEEEIRRRELLAVQMWEMYARRDTAESGETLPLDAMLTDLIRDEFSLPHFTLTNNAWRSEPQFSRYKNLALYDGAITMPAQPNATSAWKLSYDIHHCALNSDILSYVYTGTNSKQRDVLLRHIGEKTNQLIEFVFETANGMYSEQMERRHGVRVADTDAHYEESEWKSRLFQYVVNGADVDGKYDSTGRITSRDVANQLTSDVRLSKGALTPLNVACMLGQVEVVRFLVENCHADVNHEEPLLVAIRSQSCPVVDYLLSVDRVDITEYYSVLGSVASEYFDFAVFGALMMRLPWMRAQYYEEYLKRSESGRILAAIASEQMAQQEGQDSPALTPLVTNVDQNGVRQFGSTPRAAPSPVVVTQSQDTTPLHKTPFTSNMAVQPSPVAFMNQATSARGLNAGSPSGYASPAHHFFAIPPPHSIHVPPPQQQTPNTIIDINAPEHPFNQQQDDFLEEDFTDDDGFSTGDEEDTLDRLSSLQPAPLYISPNLKNFAKPLMQFAVKKKPVVIEEEEDELVAVEEE